MFFVRSDIYGEDYKLLLEYVLAQCDVMTMRIPQYSETDINLKTSHKTSNAHEAFARTYYDNACNFVETLFHKHIIKTEIANHYCESTYSDLQKIYYIRVNTEVAELLSLVDHLFAWQYPFMPEDLCFYKQGICVISSVCHESFWRIYKKDTLTKKLLRKMRLRFRYYADERPPQTPCNEKS